MASYKSVAYRKVYVNIKYENRGASIFIGKGVSGLKAWGRGVCVGGLSGFSKITQIFHNPLHTIFL